MAEVPPDTQLTKARKNRGLWLSHVADAVGTSVATLSKVERGVQTPKRDLARGLFEFFGGSVPLGAIYDAQYCPPPSVARHENRRHTRSPAGIRKKRKR